MTSASTPKLLGGPAKRREELLASSRARISCSRRHADAQNERMIPQGFDVRPPFLQFRQELAACGHGLLSRQQYVASSKS